MFAVDEPYAGYDAYIFNGISCLEDDIINLINLLDPYSNATSALRHILGNQDVGIRPIPQHSRRISEIIFNYDAKISRNPLDSGLRPILNRFFADLDFDDEVSDACYCLDPRVQDYDRQLTTLIADDLPRIGIPVQDAHVSFEEDFVRKEKQMLSSYSGSQVMLIVGGVGAGKTTFIKRFFKRILPEAVRSKILWFYVDFRQHSDELISVWDVIMCQVLEQIRTKYPDLQVDDWGELQNIYRSDIVMYQRGALKPYYEGDRSTFDKKISDVLMEKVSDESSFANDILKYLANRVDNKRLICLTIDNADQLSRDFQQKCVTAAFEFYQKYRSLVLISMREESFWQLRRIQPLDAYQNYAYHISAPSVSKVLARRLDVASKHKGTTILDIQEDNGVRCSISVGSFFGIISSSLYSGRDKKIVLIEALSAGNIRVAQEMLTTFLTSGHTNTREYIKTYLTSGDYRIPLHAVIRSLALGDYQYYHSQRSLIINLFDIDDDGFYSHFTRIRVLRYLLSRMNIESLAGKGFIRIIDAFNDFSSVCATEMGFSQILTSLLRGHLIEADNGYRLDGSEVEYVRITSAGYYYVTHLLGEFSYLERLCEDTPILSASHFRDLENLTNKILAMERKHDSGLMKLRLQRVAVFLAYLHEQEQKESTYLSAGIDLKIMDSVVTDFGRQARQILNGQGVNR